MAENTEIGDYAAEVRSGDCVTIVCCDCGLVHTFQFVLSGPDCKMNIWRNNEKTKEYRQQHPELVCSASPR
jgi:hypothetical protein